MSERRATEPETAKPEPPDSDRGLVARLRSAVNHVNVLAGELSERGYEVEVRADLCNHSFEVGRPCPSHPVIKVRVLHEIEEAQL